MSELIIMARIKFLIKNPKKSPSAILLRFSKGRSLDIQRSTSILVDPKIWNNSKGEYRSVATSENRDENNSRLRKLADYIIDSFNKDYSNGVFIDSGWLKLRIDKFHNQKSDFDLEYLVNYAEQYISSSSSKINLARGGEIGVAESTIKKYRRVVSLLKEFEMHNGVNLKVRDVDTKFQKSFIHFLIDRKYSENTIGRMIKFVKTFCLDAKSSGIRVSDELDRVKGFTKKAEFITLTESEIKSIANHDFSARPYLDNARDWFVIGLSTGQRVSDFMSFKKDLINLNNHLEFNQKKTGARTLVPLHPLLKNVLKKRNGDFPRQISEQNFNVYIKEICRDVGFVDEVYGGLFNPKTKRKEFGTFPKYKLVSSHICRRSFATNHYGKLPTPVIMAITNHSTEKMFLDYIGKGREEFIRQIEKYWDGIVTK